MSEAVCIGQWWLAGSCTNIIFAGGAANTYRPADQDVQAGRADKDRVRTNSRSSSEQPKGVAGLAKANESLSEPQGLTKA